MRPWRRCSESILSETRRTAFIRAQARPPSLLTSVMPTALSPVRQRAASHCTSTTDATSDSDQGKIHPHRGELCATLLPSSPIRPRTSLENTFSLGLPPRRKRPPLHQGMRVTTASAPCLFPRLPRSFFRWLFLSATQKEHLPSPHFPAPQPPQPPQPSPSPLASFPSPLHLKSHLSFFKKKQNQKLSSAERKRTFTSGWIARP